ncbi:helix-turn-helix domain-containing protein [Streptomyces cellostaticus]|uniref:helix-turn-helix domain-containing protein n=1 Tax=Streptomyces cellostaticus TaxID=67285 RepID=UPI002542085F|nr:helix-turn-helix domain-containing protein [Streptomyces cellostaticus]
MPWTTEAPVRTAGGGPSRPDRNRGPVVRPATAPVVFRTRDVPGPDRAGLWSDAVRDAMGPVTVLPRDHRSFSGQLTSSEHGCLRVVALDADAHLIRREAASDGESPGTTPGSVTVVVQTSGSSVLIQRDRRTRLAPADVALLLTDRAFSLELPDRAGLRLFRMPRGSLPLRDEQVLSGSTDAAGRAVAPLLTGLAETMTRLRPEAGARVAGSLVEALALQVAPEPPARSAEVADLMSRIRAHIEDRLADPGLSPASIAAAHHISVRYVHRLFAQEGTTVGTWIRHRRLEASRRELTRRESKPPTIAAVGHRCGFVSASHFGRAFRQTYGMTPHAWRRLHAPSRSAG